jgi:LPXTG-motif cell wall-anchored protein
LDEKRKEMRKEIKIMMVAVTILMVLLSTTQAAFAASVADVIGKVDSARQCSLQLKYIYDEIPYENLHVSLYRIADVSDSYEYSLYGSFAGYPLDLSSMNSQKDWDSLKSTVDSYIIADEIEADFTAVTNQSGEACFSDLNTGVYFIPEISVEKEKREFQFESCILVIPQILTDGSLEYDVTAAPKAFESKGRSGLTPDNPTTPDTSTTPETPTTTTRKTTSTTPTRSTSTTTPKTGDDSNLFLWTYVGIVSGLILLYHRMRSKKKR